MAVQLNRESLAAPENRVFFYARQRPAIWSATLCIIIHSVVVVLAISTWLCASGWPVLAVGGALVLGTYPLIAFQEAKRGPFWLNPLSFYFAWAVGVLGISPLYMAEVTMDRTDRKSTRL